MTVFRAKKEMTIPISTVVVPLYAIDVLTCHTYRSLHMTLAVYQRGCYNWGEGPTGLT